MRLAEHFFSLLAPSNCLVCGEEGSLICLWCQDEALPGVAPRCYRCNRLSAQSATCPACRRHSVIKHLFVRTEYSDVARNLVHTMKFKYSGEAADIIAAELLNTLPALTPDTIIVPIPTATTHIRKRGMDHAVRIAKKLAVLTKRSYAPALTRSGQSRQVGSSRQTRLQQMNNVFKVRQPLIVEGAPILLVDDVLTTGATIEAAARALKAAGAKSIDAVIFAQAK